MNPVKLSVSPIFEAAKSQGTYLELQDQSLYSLITLPTPLTAAGGVAFFGDTIATVTPDRTNLDRSNQVPIGSTYEIHGIGIKFLAPLTVVFASFVTATRDAWLELFVNNSLRFRAHLREFLQAVAYAPSFSAAAGDSPIVTDQGIDGWRDLALPITINDYTNFNVRIFFATDVAALNNTVAGVWLGGIINRGNIKLDSTPTVPAYRSGL